MFTGVSPPPPSVDSGLFGDLNSVRSLTCVLLYGPFYQKICKIYPTERDSSVLSPV